MIRSYWHDHPGDLLHVDVKKLGRIPDGGGWRGTGDRAAFPDRRRKTGWEFVHSIVDDHSRTAYTEIHTDEKGDTVAAFTQRALALFAAHGIAVKALLTDNASADRPGRQLKGLLAAHGNEHRFIGPYRPQTNGKVERFNRTLLEAWAYAQVFTSSQDCAQAFDGFLHT